MSKPRAPSRSGANIPETQRKTVQRKLRITPESDVRLAKLAQVAGVNASRLVEAMIDLEYDAMKPKPKREPYVLAAAFFPPAKPKRKK